MAVDVAKLIWRPNGLRSLDYSRLLPGDLPVNVETCKKRSRKMRGSVMCSAKPEMRATQFECY
ncbi:hypothetical protein SNOG_12107 [Parastagonospora nodorum SN15]|uniref:Uncharacterized protein n=1 Tax=Phaeosphaeria nodorum (strain SN15 / ATCC MYA-4574 / FGSC 10173) TaxID=321614 RepID=Q0U807_PHANO|nr:hypothetical protein SNOG_12107 [Parastagonospora nodorum SN15]EAT80519.1 hypothetical protein SNOG_12107 [Parastagonospora nodorum SN15]